MESSIAIITARGGSKRIPQKNIRDFCGRPIITYSIEAALQSGLFDEVMVSTEDEEIARIAREAGAQVPFMRSSASAGDYASTDDVIMEVLEAYRKQGREFETFCCLYPTAPFDGTEAAGCHGTFGESGFCHARGGVFFSAAAVHGAERSGRTSDEMAGTCQNPFPGSGTVLS